MSDQEKLENRIKQFISRHDMIHPGDHVIAGVSGGADSMCMLLVLLHLRQTCGHTVSVVHVEHGIRAQDSRMDAEFVRHFCGQESIECHICHYCVPEYAREHGMSEEEAGRVLRYEAFAAEKEKYSIRKKSEKIKIAVAHNLSDQAETMLFHLARGTGIRGLAAVRPVRGDIIRPLLNTSREEIETYLAQAGQEFCTDATNADDGYSRNQIRHHVLPGLEKVNSRAVLHMYQTADQLREIDSFLERIAAGELKRCCALNEPDSGKPGIKKQAVISKDAFEKADPVIQKRMLYQLLAELSGSAKNLTNEHICQVKNLFSRQISRLIRLPYGLKAVRVYEGVKISAEDYDGEDGEDKMTDVRPDQQFSFQLVENTPNSIPIISKKKYTKCFDYDKIKTEVCIRTRQPGDYLSVNDSGERQKLKKYLINEKVPSNERGQLLLLADGAHIMWVVGHRMSCHYKVEEHTRRILVVTYRGGKEDE